MATFRRLGFSSGSYTCLEHLCTLGVEFISCQLYDNCHFGKFQGILRPPSCKSKSLKSITSNEKGMTE
jgi:hypothetical protein